MVQDHGEQALRRDLESHGRFVRKLAAGLLGLGLEAEDLAQDTLLAALKHRGWDGVPRSARRAWLATTLRRLAIGRRRSSATRSQGEASYAQIEREPNSPLDLSLHKETIRSVSDAVLDLEEPYLSTVLLTYYRDQSASAVAETLDVSLATVRSRLQRAREQLRTKLMRQHGGSEKTLDLALLALVPSALQPRPVALATAGKTSAAGTLALGTAFMSVKWTAALAGLGLVAWLGWKNLDAPDGSQDLQRATAPEKQALAPPAGSADAAETGGPTVKASDDAGERQALVPTPTKGPTPSPEGPPPQAPTSGLFAQVLYEGEPVPDAAVSIHTARIADLEDAEVPENKRFVVHDPIPKAIFANQGGYSTYEVSSIDGERNWPDYLVDTHGAPAMPSVKTDEQGYFRFPALPDEPFVLTIQQVDRSLALRDRPRLPQPGESLDLGAIELQAAATLRGKLRFTHSLQLDGHRLSIAGLRGFEGVTDEDGAFQIHGLPPGPAPLRISPGPGVFQGQTATPFLQLKAGEDRVVDLKLSSEPCSLVSVEVTSNGQPYAEESINFLRRDNQRSIYLGLDGQGRGTVTLPTQVAMQPLAALRGNQLSLGQDIVLQEPEADLRLSVELGAIEVRVPAACLPAPDTCQLQFHSNDPIITDLRFDIFPGIQGEAQSVDPSGKAQLILPAWTRLEPLVRYEGRVWVHLETDRVAFPAGPVDFRIDRDPESGGLTLSGVPSQEAQEQAPAPKQYRVALRWPADLTGESQSLTSMLNPLLFAASPAKEQTFLFESVPIGKRRLQIVLQRKHGNGWAKHMEWSIESEVMTDGVTTISVPETTEER